MNTLSLVIFALFALIGVNELLHDVLRNYNRKKNYMKAVELAKEKQKKLLVIGDPHNGRASNFYGPQYMPGDVTIDLAGCEHNICNSIKRDACSVLQEMASNSCVIYVSCTLEYIPHVQETMREIRRVSGNDYVITHVHPCTLTAWCYSRNSTRVFNVIFKTIPDLIYYDVNSKKIYYI